jgi:hypothetical protein
MSFSQVPVANRGDNGRVAQPGELAAMEPAHV